MSVHYLNINERKNTTSYIAGLSNFSVVDGESTSPDILLENANISFYCLDDESQRAIFVELPPDVDLGKVPFVFQTQTHQAQRFIAVPYTMFKQLSDKLAPLDHLIFMYTTGRCGSTLLSNAFNEVANILSLPEIGVITQFVYLRSLGNYQDSELCKLLDPV